MSAGRDSGPFSRLTELTDMMTRATDSIRALPPKDREGRSPVSGSNPEFDIYRSDLAKSQLDYDRKDYRRSLYTNIKSDHPSNPRTEGPCNCNRGDTAWERSGIAMRVEWPPEPVREQRRAEEQSRGTPRTPQPRKRTSRGRSR